MATARSPDTSSTGPTWMRAPDRAQLRAAFAAMRAGSPSPVGVTLAPSALGGRPALEIEPEDGAILYFHRGTRVCGSSATAQHITAALVRRTGARAVSLDYRLAPEHPFPAGDSAGGGLSIMPALAARDADLPRPAGVVAFAPGLDATRSGESMTPKGGIDPLFTRRSLVRQGAHYVAGQDPRQPLLSPTARRGGRGAGPGRSLHARPARDLPSRAQTAGLVGTLRRLVGTLRREVVAYEETAYSGSGRSSTTCFMTRVEVRRCTPGSVASRWSYNCWKAERSAVATRSR